VYAACDMRLWIDAREACRERKTGKGQWTLRTVGALLARHDVQATIVSDAPVPPGWNGMPGLAAVKVVEKKGLAWHLAVAKLLKKERADIDAYLSPTSFIVPFLVGRRVPVVPVVHDLIAFKNEPHDRKATLIERLTLPRALRTALAVCCVSEATAALVHAKFRGVTRTFVAGAGPTVGERDAWTGTGDFVLSIGTLCPRKNQLRLIHAYASLPAEVRSTVKLVLVGGRGWDDDAIVEIAANTPGVEWKGFQSTEACAELLRTCKAFAWVSEEEGFGLPVLDALRVGAPVLASDIPTNREVAGDAAAYCDPLDRASIARGLSAVVERGEFFRSAGLERADMFSWEKVAAQIVERTAHSVDIPR
jgi:glycosyltransferase involved in cell wall biosynthesis